MTRMCPRWRSASPSRWFSVVAGLAFDDGLLTPDQPVHEVLDVPEFQGTHNERITWRHLLQQSSQWVGELWGKPTDVDKQSFREGTEVHGTPPGAGWAYNDVRMNLLAYALTLLFRRPLPDVLGERVMNPIGASERWSWHGYQASTVDLDGHQVHVVSGGAHWGGGLFISARDLSLIGQLFLDQGSHAGTQLLSAEWIEQSWTPCPVQTRIRLPVVAQRRADPLAGRPCHRPQRPLQRRSTSSLGRPCPPLGPHLTLDRTTTQSHPKRESNDHTLITSRQRDRVTQPRAHRPELRLAWARAGGG